MVPPNQANILSEMADVAANPIALPIAAVVVGVTVIAVAGELGFKAWEHHNKKKHKLKIEAIMRLYQTHFANIPVHDNKQMIRFSEIFKATNDPKIPWDIGHFTEDDLEEMGTVIALGTETDPALSEFKQSIVAAIGNLRSYCKHHPDQQGTTVVVIQYLMSILNTRVLNFKDYESAIEELNAISNFIDAYASSVDSEVTVHFSRLRDVYPYIETAKQYLQKHKDNLSLEDLIGELRSTCINDGNQLIRKFTQLIIPEADRALVGDAPLDKLMNGVLRREYIGAQVFGLVTQTDELKLIPESRFKEWLSYLIKYYIQARSPDITIQSREAIAPENLFTYPDLELLQALKKSKKDGQPTDLDKINSIKDELDALREQFAEYQNFITMKLDKEQYDFHQKPSLPTNPFSKLLQFVKKKLGFSKPLFVPVTEDIELIERVKVFADFATSIHKIISLEYLCTHLLKTIKQLGEIRVNNPHHFCKLFKTLSDLCDEVGKSVKDTEEAFTHIQQSNANVMQLYGKQTLRQSLLAQLGSTKAIIIRLGATVQQHRERLIHKVMADEPASLAAQREMVQVVDMLNTMYHFIPGEATNSQLDTQSVHENLSEADRTPLAAFNLPFPAPQHAPIIRPPVESYPKSYGSMFTKMTDKASLKGHNPSMQALLGIRELLNDYTKSDVAVFRFFSGHWNRHHVVDIAKFVKTLDITISLVAHGNMEVNQEDVGLFLRRLLDKKNEPGVKPSGSLAWRIDFILAQCKAKGILPGPAIVNDMQLAF